MVLLQQRLSMQNVPNSALFLVVLTFLWASLIPPSVVLFFEMLRRTQQKETLMLVAQSELVYHLKIKWSLMRFGSSCVILLVIRLCVLYLFLCDLCDVGFTAVHSPQPSSTHG